MYKSGAREGHEATPNLEIRRLRNLGYGHYMSNVSVRFIFIYFYLVVFLRTFFYQYF